MHGWQADVHIGQYICLRAITLSRVGSAAPYGMFERTDQVGFAGGHLPLTIARALSGQV